MARERPLRFEFLFANEAERAAYESAAAEKGVTLAAWIRNAAREQNIREKIERLEYLRRLHSSKDSAKISSAGNGTPAAES